MHVQDKEDRCPSKDVNFITQASTLDKGYWIKSTIGVSLRTHCCGLRSRICTKLTIYALTIPLVPLNQPQVSPHCVYSRLGLFGPVTRNF